VPWAGREVLGEGSEPWANAGEGPADVVQVAPETWMVDVDCARPALDSLVVVAAKATGWAIVVHQSRFHPRETWSRGPAVVQTFAAARIAGGEQHGPLPAPTRDLIGARHLLRYDRNNLYEHVYLNSERFCSHNVHTRGTPGRADCHPASYWKLADGLYVFAWREYDSAAAMVFTYNLNDLRATGMAHAPDTFMRSENRPIGGHILPVTETVSYPDGLTPR